MDTTAPEGTTQAKKPSAIAGLIARVMALKPVRVFLHYGAQRGPILAAGLSYQAIFATFAAIWVAFSVAGLVIASTPRLQDALFDVISTSVPGLIDDGSGSGAISRDVLLSAGALTWTGAIALVGLLMTTLGWLASGRDAVRTIFGIGAEKLNFLLLKLKDLGLAIGFGVALLISAALSVLSTSALDFVFGLFGVDSASVPATIGARIVGLLLVFAFDSVVLALFFRVVSGIHIPFRLLAGGALIGAAALGVLKALGSALLGGATSNPLLASFAVIIGLLIWFNFICQVILISAAWIAVGMSDAGIAADPVAEAERLEKERQEREQIEREIREERDARPRGLARLFRRRRP